MSYKWGECSGCLSDGLLKRVAIYPGVLEVVHVYMCIDCRVNWRDDQYASLVESFKFNRVARAEWREYAAMKKAVDAAREKIEGGKPLGAEFERVWDAHAEQLYER